VIKHYKGIVGRLEEAAEGKDARTTTRRQRIKGELARAEESKASLEQLKEIAKSWLALSERARSRTRSLRPSDFRQYR
jgi:F0F1-type ATP synthase membrane subunit b/b'